MIHAAGAAAPASSRSTLGRVPGGQRGLEQLPDRPERELALELRATRAQDAQPDVRCKLAREREQRALSRPGRPFDHD